MLPLTTAARDEWLKTFVEGLVRHFPQIEEVYLLGDRARGVVGQLPDFNVLIFAGYENALELLMALARSQYQLCPMDGDAIVHVYVENYGNTLAGIWGGGHITNEALRNWHQGNDFLILYARQSDQGPGLAARIQDPLERRQQHRRLFERRQESREVSDRRDSDRRRELAESKVLR